MSKKLHLAQLSRFSAATVVASAVAILAGCASQPSLHEKTASWSPNKIYSQARGDMEGGSYDAAIPMYTVLEGRAAGTPLAQQAQLEKAYAYYLNEDLPQARDTLDRFIRLHPSSAGIDYALYLRGLVNFGTQGGWLSFLTKQELAERDMAAAKESFRSFKELVTRFPDSKYTPDARKRMVYVLNSLSASEVAIADYYFRRGAYVAAINRAQTAIRDYDSTPALEPALAIIVASYDKLGLAQPRDDAQRVLTQNYPQSQYVNKQYAGKDKSFWQLW